MQAFGKQVADYSKSSFNITLAANLVDRSYSVALFEAVWLYAHAATKVLAMGEDLREAGVAVTEVMRNITIDGVGNSTVSLNEQGDRIHSYEVMNYILEADGGMTAVPVGKFSHVLQQYTASERLTMWPGSTTAVPIDYLSGMKKRAAASW